LNLQRDILTPSFTVLCVSIAVFGACGEESVVLSDHTPSAIEVATEAVEEQTPEDLPLPAFTELTVREFLSTWLQARSNRDFDTYATLYATRFDGIDYSGDAPVRFVREQWLNAQEGHFSTPQNLEIARDRYSLIPGGALVILKEKRKDIDDPQTYQRELLLIAEDGRLKIARERLLDERFPLNTEKKRRRHKLLRDFFFVLDNRYVVFDSSDMEKDGALYVNDTTALKRARKEVLPKAYRKLLKRKFVVGYADGSTSITAITDTRAVAKYAVHNAIESYWKSKGLSEVQMGELLWELASGAGSIYLVGILKKTGKQALWAYPVAPRTPEIYESRKLDRAYVKNIRHRFEKYKTSKFIQQNFESFGLEGPWMSYESTSRARLFKSPRGNRRYATVSISAGKGCGGFYGYLQGFFHMQKGILYNMGLPPRGFQDSFIDDRDVIQAIDIDHDGIPEFVAPHKLMYKIDDDWYIYELKIPRTDWPC
jgi:hypothetical protein